MRIVFDAYWWVAGPPSLRHVLRETVLGWHHLYPDDELVLVVRAAGAEAARRELPAEIRVESTALWPQALSAVLACALVARKVKADVVYTQNFAPPISSAFTVVFLHDVLYKTNPEWFTRTERLYFNAMPLLAARADLVLTSSATEADRIRSNSGARVVAAVGLGVSDELIHSRGGDARPGLEPGSFLLTVGRLNVRKNLATTIRGAIASGMITPERPLVVVGSANGKGEVLPSEIEAAVADGRVQFTGFLADSTLRWLYENTALFLFLTHGEGFGMPAVEAAYFNAPMIVSDLEVFREILPDRTRRVNPSDLDGIAVAIRDELTSGPGRTATRPTYDARYAWPRVISGMRDAIVETAAQAGREFV